MVYGKRKVSVALNRHFLHAYRLKIIVPGEKVARVFEAPLPEELQKALEEVRSKK